MVHVFNADNFDQQVLKSEVPVLVDCYAPWCRPCTMIAPIIERLADNFQGVKIGKLNTDENIAVSTKYNINAIPTLLYFKGGTLVDQQVGMVREADIRQKLDGLKIA